jgi:PBSX family phage terminase large subunit
MKLMQFKLTQKQQEALAIVRAGHDSILLAGGSRSGKTTLSVLLLTLRALKYPGARFFVSRLYLSTLVPSVVEDTFPKVCALLHQDLWDSIMLNRKYMFARFANKSEIWFFGLQDGKRADKALGNEYAGGLLEEVSEIDYASVQLIESRLAQRVHDDLRIQLFATCNPPARSHWAYKRYVKLEDPTDGTALKRAENGFLLMNPADNLDNLPNGYMRRLETLSERQRRRFLHGEFVDDVENALWKQDYIKRAPEGLQFDRIVIGIDPAVSAHKDSDETGIVVAARIRDKAYVLEDASSRYTPSSWACKVLELFKKYKADRIIAEVNQGGDLVKQNLKAVGQNLPISTIRAKRGKVTRADAVVALYEQNKVFHVGVHRGLEDQMLSWVPEGHDSPDRIDAFVYCVWYLLLNKSEGFVLSV